jgi:hypothetical protein
VLSGLLELSQLASQEVNIQEDPLREAGEISLNLESTNTISRSRKPNEMCQVGANLNTLKANILQIKGITRKEVPMHMGSEEVEGEVNSPQGSAP